MIRVYWYPSWAKCFILNNKPPWPIEWTYFIHGADEYGHVKIGKTEDLSRRLDQIDRGVPFQVQPVLALDSRICSENAAFVQFNNWRKRGDWFRPAPSILKLIYTLEE